MVPTTIVPALISVRSGSSRLKKKCFLKIDDELTMLEHVIEKCKNVGFMPVVATTYEQEDDAIAAIAQTNAAACYRGSVDDKLDRWFCACKHFDIKSFVTVDCDDPLFDPTLIQSIHDQLIDEKRLFDVVVPDMSAYLGSHGYAMTFDALRNIVEKKASKKTEMIWYSFKDVPELKIKQAKFEVVEHESDIRLTLDYEEDYWLIRTVVRQLGRNCNREEILKFFDEKPGLVSINQFRIDEWKTRQNNFKNV